MGGGFGIVVAAERLAKLLAPEHRITLVSREGGTRNLAQQVFEAKAP